MLGQTMLGQTMLGQTMLGQTMLGWVNVGSGTGSREMQTSAAADATPLVLFIPMLAVLTLHRYPSSAPTGLAQA